jgi:hypothetical protein
MLWLEVPYVLVCDFLDEEPRDCEARVWHEVEL